MIYISYLWLLMCLISTIIILVHIIKHPQHMKIMNYVWPINALWGGPIILWIYFTLGVHRKMPHMTHMDMMNMDHMKNMNMNMKQMNMNHMENTNNDMNHTHMNMNHTINKKASKSKINHITNMDKKSYNNNSNLDSNKSNSTSKYQHFWQGIVVDALHCGAGCSLADLIGAWIFFYCIPFAIGHQLIFGEWIFDYVLALITGVFFQYAAIKNMTKGTTIQKILKAFKIDFWSLTSWQVGMYGWSAIVHFAFHWSYTPINPIYWLMMCIGMFLGLLTAYPTNWILVKLNVKSGM